MLCLLPVYRRWSQLSDSLFVSRGDIYGHFMSSDLPIIKKTSPRWISSLTDVGGPHSQRCPQHFFSTFWLWGRVGQIQVVCHRTDGKFGRGKQGFVPWVLFINYQTLIQHWSDDALRLSNITSQLRSEYVLYFVKNTNTLYCWTALRVCSASRKILQ